MAWCILAQPTNASSHIVSRIKKGHAWLGAGRCWSKPPSSLHASSLEEGGIGSAGRERRREGERELEDGRVHGLAYLRPAG